MENDYPASALRMEAIRRSASRFRRAMERCDPHDLPASCKEFPLGSCGVASLMLGSYLADEGFGRFEYVVGEYRDDAGWHSHSWLRQGVIVVDITADQFAGMEERVIVSDDSAWHRSLSQGADGEANFRMHDEQTNEELAGAYKNILAQMKAA